MRELKSSYESVGMSKGECWGNVEHDGILFDDSISLKMTSKASGHKIVHLIHVFWTVAQTHAVLLVPQKIPTVLCCQTIYLQTVRACPFIFVFKKSSVFRQRYKSTTHSHLGKAEKPAEFHVGSSDSATILDVQMGFCSSPLLGIFILSEGQRVFPHSEVNKYVWQIEQQVRAGTNESATVEG